MTAGVTASTRRTDVPWLDRAGLGVAVCAVVAADVVASWPLVAGALQPVKSMRTSPTATATAEARSVRSARYAGWPLECVIAVTM